MAWTNPDPRPTNAGWITLINECPHKLGATRHPALAARGWRKKENEKGRFSEADKRGGFRVRDPQGCCYGFTNNQQHAHFSRFPSPFLLLLLLNCPHHFSALIFNGFIFPFALQLLVFHVINYRLDFMSLFYYLIIAKMYNSCVDWGFLFPKKNVAGSFAETEHREVTFPEISTTILEKICQYFYWSLQYAKLCSFPSTFFFHVPIICSFSLSPFSELLLI